LLRAVVNAVRHRFRAVVARDDGRADDPMRPPHWFALRIQPRADAVVIVWAVHVVLDVLLARPDHLHGPANLLCDLHRPHGPVVFETAAKSATQQVVVDAHLLAREPGALDDRGLSHALDLRADPDVATVARHLHGAIHRLHRRVREKRLLIDRLDLARGAGNGRGGIAFMTRDRARLLRG